MPGAGADADSGDRDYLVLTKLNVIMNVARLRPLELPWDSLAAVSTDAAFFERLAIGPNLRPTSLCHGSTSSTGRFSLSP